MPEVGNMGLPAKLLAKGVKDMVRISDGRMSGTGFGTVVLHVAPESADGGALGYRKGWRRDYTGHPSAVATPPSIGYGNRGPAGC